MFSSHVHLKKRTPEGGIPRPDYIEHLVEEYHTTTNIEAQEQVTANLCNFAYDPINWKYLKEVDALGVFEECAKSPNERLQLHGISALCNMCFDSETYKFITKLEVLALIHKLLHTTEATDIHLNCIALLYQLLISDNCRPEMKNQIAAPYVLKKVTELRNSPDPRVKNIASLFCEDFGSRFEQVVDMKYVLTSAKTVQKPNSNNSI